MRTWLRLLPIGALILGLSLAAAPASALSTNASPGHSESGYKVTWQGSKIDISALLSSGDFAKFLRPPGGTSTPAADAILTVLGKLDERFGALWSEWRPRTTTPSTSPAIPEPTAALAFGLGLVIATRRRR